MNFDLINIHKQARSGINGALDRAAVAKSRAMHGIDETDVWCLHDYLAQVMINGITMLRKNSHGWPGGEEHPEPDDWDIALVDICMRLKQASTRFEQHDRVFDEIAWKPEDAMPLGIEDFEDWFNRPNSPEQQEYSRRCTEIDDLAQENIEYVMTWFSKWWFALWD